MFFDLLNEYKNSVNVILITVDIALLTTIVTVKRDKESNGKITMNKEY